MHEKSTFCIFPHAGGSAFHCLSKGLSEKIGMKCTSAQSRRLRLLSIQFWKNLKGFHPAKREFFRLPCFLPCASPSGAIRLAWLFLLCWGFGLWACGHSALPLPFSYSFLWSLSKLFCVCDQFFLWAWIVALWTVLAAIPLALTPFYRNKRCLSTLFFACDQKNILLCFQYVTARLATREAMPCRLCALALSLRPSAPW